MTIFQSFNMPLTEVFNNPTFQTYRYFLLVGSQAKAVYTMDSSKSSSRDPEKASANPIDDPELLNQPPFNIPPETRGSRSNGQLQPPGRSETHDEKPRSRSSLAGLPNRWKSTPRVDGKRELTEEECYDILAYSWPKWKKWGFLSVSVPIKRK